MLVLKTPNGRVVEFNEHDPFQLLAVQAGASLQKVTVDKMHRAFFCGPHLLKDEESPYKHNKFPYVIFWGKREDRTGIPCGYARDMMFLQDEINARVAKQQWLLSAKRVTRSEGAVAMSDEIFRRTINRPDADIILSKEEMKDGGIFDVAENFALNEEQAARLVEVRIAIKRAGRVSDSFQGVAPASMSGTAMSSMIEQTVQGLAGMTDNFLYSRRQVGDLLLAMIIEDIGDKQEKVIVKGNLLKGDTEIVLNMPVTDENGIEYLDNDIQRTMVKVDIEEVPSTPSFRAQQLQSLTEAFKSTTTEVQMVALPHLLQLMDIPDKEDIVSAVKQLTSVPTPEAIQQQIKQAVSDALLKEIGRASCRERV